ncbi:hypothetical protein BDN71DRAFT_1434323 [Pleurotus eryngii]|uniref:Uncharacterized protein n=1 Tax=Pleurotus eryngii TaxID=5323 RepID=A0A9P5ZN97_PLEER|nr:hypothetical protein BDN71DRAFT_1434323 [Pleurotus eryngii]
MKNRAEVYLRVVDTSVTVTSAGVRIAKMIIAVVEASEDLEVSTITGVKQSAAENAKDAKRIQEDFRQLRGSLMNFHRALNPRSPPILGRMPENSFVETNGLETMADEDFFAFTTQIIDQFLATVTEFIEWWGGLMSELAGVEDYMKRLKPGREDSGHRLFIAKLWKSIESEYKTYNADVTAQQDYYRPELNEVLRKNVGVSVARFKCSPNLSTRLSNHVTVRSSVNEMTPRAFARVYCYLTPE